jgi:hypothetical protein
MPAKAQVYEATPQIKNLILVALTKPEYRQLLPDLKFVELPSGKVCMKPVSASIIPLLHEQRNDIPGRGHRKWIAL